MRYVDTMRRALTATSLLSLQAFETNLFSTVK